MYNYYENFYEPSENDIVMEEIGDILKKMIRKEIMDELEALRKENAELQEFKRAKEAYERELELAKAGYESMARSEANRVKRMRIHDLFGDELTVGYMAAKNAKRKPKCDKCDDNRCLHYTTPRGRDATEYCECNGYDYTYEVKESELLRFKISKNCWDVNESVYKYYKHVNDTYDDKDDSNDYALVSHVYQGESFAVVKNSYSDYLFLDKTKCQEYCDWLNEQEAKES